MSPIGNLLDDGFEPRLLGSGAAMQQVLSEIAQLATVPWIVRIEGPTGTGKRLAARMIHALSDRAAKPFVHCHLNMIPDGREHAELVGWVRGAFTGAVSDHAGDFEQAHEGVAFLDEVALATPTVQRALLQLVDEQAVRRIGDARVRHVDVRIISATNVLLEDEVAVGRFREDLYYRLGKLLVRMPALVDHLEDIPELVAVIVERKTCQAGKPVRDVTPRELHRLLDYEWPGNVRELEHVVEYFVTWERLPADLARNAVRTEWRRHVDSALTRYEGDKAATARALGISRKTLYQELKRRQS